MDNEQLIDKLVNVVKGYRHEKYNENIELSDKYTMLVSGEEIDPLLKQFNLRESDELYAQRLRMTKTVVGAVSEKITNPFFKLSRSNNVNIELKYTNERYKSNIGLLQSNIDNFWGNESLPGYLENQYIHNSFTDPNAFLVSERIIDGEVVKAIPFMAKSKNSYDFEYTNNILDYLITGEEWNSKVDKKVLNNKRFTIYGKDTVLTILKTDKDYPNNYDIDSLPTVMNEQYITINKISYTIWEFKTDINEVPAEQIGYIYDQIDGKSFISPMHKAIPRMEKLINADSELDLTIALHVFPQKIQAVRKCVGKQSEPCDNGNVRGFENKKCTVCNGSGKITVTSAQDVLEYTLPTSEELKEGAIPLDPNNLVIYKTPPIDLIKFQDEYTSKLEAEAVKDVFVSNAFERGNGTVTATEKNIDYDSVLDTIYPFGTKYSNIYKKMVRLNAKYISVDFESDLTVIHSFPKDLKIKSTSEYISELKSANENDAPEFIKAQLSEDIANKIYYDDPYKMKVFKIKNEHTPFKGKSQTEKLFLISGGYASQEDVILYSQFETIFKQLEDETFNGSNPTSFYDLPYVDRVDKINTKVSDILLKQANEQLGSLNLDILEGGENLGVEDLDTPVDVELEAKAKLKGSVGGVQGIINTAQSVANGSMSLESGVALLVLIYGFDDKEAKSLLIKPKQAIEKLENNG